MKTITIILIILFLFVSCLFSFLIIKKIFQKEPSQSEQSEVIIEEDEVTPLEELTPDEEREDKILPEDITKIEIYLDGYKNDGIFLGEAVYGLSSKEAFLIYGDKAADSGYALVWDNEEYTFEPGSTHYLYVYTYIPKYGWDYTRTKIQVPGEPGNAENIKMSVDSLRQNEVIKEDKKNKLRISGWAADFNVTDSTGIDKVEIYLNGPKGFGKFLGEAKYGLERQDVADAFGNPNYLNSGYSFTYDASSFEPGSLHSFYVYSLSSKGEYQLIKVNIIMEGEEKESNTITSVEAKFGNGKIEIIGWVVNKNITEEGKPRSLDIEYSTKKIVFVSNKTGNEDIFSMNLDGSELTQLTDHPGMDTYPSVSPNGKKIAYTSDIDGTWQLVLMNWDGTEKVQITNNRKSGYPTWSFDSRYIFFEMYIDGDWELYRIDSGGSNVKRLTFNPNADDWHPYSHPFQCKVFYESGTIGHEDIYIMDYDGENIKKVSENNRRKRVPAISIDAKLIAFMGYEGKNSNIFIMDNNGENIQKLTDNPENCGHPDISPDNAFITYEGKVNGQNEIFIMNIDGSNQIQLTNIPGHDWDPVFMYQISQ
ncbi:Tol-Pal system protein TolB [subsurface metagenome]